MWKKSSNAFIHNHRPLVMAHRGDSANIPENTPQAFEDAVKLGVDVIETDLHLTKDGEFVFFHDERLDRTMNSKGKPSEYTLQQLKAMDMGYWFKSDENREYPFRGKGLKISTIEEIIPKYPKMRFNLDIKDKVEQAPVILAEKLEEMNAVGRVQVGSFHQKQIDRFRKLSQATTSAGPKDLLQFRTKAFKYIRKNKATLNKGGLTQEQIFGKFLPYFSLTAPMGYPFDSFSPLLKIITPEVIQFAHLLEIAVHVWTINEAGTMKQLLDWDIDGIFTDKPKVLIEVINNGF